MQKIRYVPTGIPWGPFSRWLSPQWLDRLNEEHRATVQAIQKLHKATQPSAMPVSVPKPAPAPAPVQDDFKITAVKSFEEEVKKGKKPAAAKLAKVTPPPAQPEPPVPPPAQPEPPVPTAPMAPPVAARDSNMLRQQLMELELTQLRLRQELELQELTLSQQARLGSQQLMPPAPTLQLMPPLQPGDGLVSGPEQARAVVAQAGEGGGAAALTVRLVLRGVGETAALAGLAGTPDDEPAGLPPAATSSSAEPVRGSGAAHTRTTSASRERRQPGSAHGGRAQGRAPLQSGDGLASSPEQARAEVAQAGEGGGAAAVRLVLRGVGETAALAGLAGTPDDKPAGLPPAATFSSAEPVRGSGAAHTRTTSADENDGNPAPPTAGARKGARTKLAVLPAAPQAQAEAA
ncbi:hypothetical protein T492DRAFT_915780 [Pavlovales sp. CCMP2436]|nr:hypothetical protein T492DRAFT_915780 [Pavlovales sp. CCMP2436]